MYLRALQTLRTYPDTPIHVAGKAFLRVVRHREKPITTCQIKTYKNTASAADQGNRPIRKKFDETPNAFRLILLFLRFVSLQELTMKKELTTYDLLNSINAPEDLRKLKVAQLPEVCKELRQDIIQELSKNPGHFAASMGTVELTVALHYVFNTPYDRIVWDVGHQAYGPLSLHPMKANTTHSAADMPPTPYRPHWAWPLLPNAREKTTDI